jgi:hypothetical protein
VEAIEQQIPAAEMEPMMKIQEVILKAMAGKLKWWEEALHKRSRRSLERRLRPSGISPKGITQNRDVTKNIRALPSDISRSE